MTTTTSTTQYLIKPVQATLTQDKSWHGRPECYMSVKVGGKKIKSQVGKLNGEAQIDWTDSFVIPKVGEPTTVEVTLKDKAKFFGKKLCNFTLDLKEVEVNKYVAKWYPLHRRNKPAGQIYVKCELQLDGVSVYVPPQPESQVQYEQKYDEYGYAIPGQVEPVMVNKEGLRSPIKLDEEGRPINNVDSIFLNQNQPISTLHNPQVTHVEEIVHTNANPVVTNATGQHLHAGLQPAEEVLTPAYIQEGSYRIPTVHDYPSHRGASKGLLESVGVYHLRTDPDYQLTHAHEEYRVPNNGAAGEDQKVIVDKFVEVKIVEETQPVVQQVEGVEVIPQETYKSPIQVQDDHLQQMINDQDRDIQRMIQAQDSEIQRMIQNSNVETQRLMQQGVTNGETVYIERTVTTSYHPTVEGQDIRNQEVAGI